MANERALGVSSVYAVQTWRQLAEPARGCGRILIIASAGVEPRRGRRNRHHPRWAVTVSSSPTAKAPRWAACVPSLDEPVSPGVVLQRGPVQTIRGAERLH
jgi:hypothetical protein